MTTVVPAILPDNFDHLKEELAMVHTFVSRVQIDVANGTYAPSTTWPYARKIDSIFVGIQDQKEGMPFWKDLDFEIDLLLSEPEKYISNWIQAGAGAFVVHIESTKRHAECAEMVREGDCELGWGMSPKTSTDELYEHIEKLGMPDFVQVMGNDKIGYHGVELDPQVYDIVRDIAEQYPDLAIAVDIGVNEETAPKLVEAGATKLISGSAILHAEHPEATIAQFKSL